MADTIISVPATTATMTALTSVEQFFAGGGAITLTSLVPSGVVTFPPETAMAARMIFRCIVTGGENELDDLEIPISAFTATVREGDPSSLSCDIPCGSEYIDAILARSDGDIVIRSGYLFADGTEYLEEIVRVNYENYSSERTAGLDKIAITGHKTRTLGESKDWTLGGVSYFTVNTEGQRRVRGNLDFQVRCGDIITYGSEIGDYLTAGAISYYVSARPAAAVMEIEEA